MYRESDDLDDFDDDGFTVPELAAAFTIAAVLTWGLLTLVRG